MAAGARRGGEGRQQLVRERRRPASAAAAALALLACCQRFTIAAAQGADLKDLMPEQLGQLVAYNLQSEEQRPNETLFSFNEFQDIAEMDCQSRLITLLNWTANLQDGVESYHSDVLGIAGLYMRLLESAPDENTWIWLLTSSHERVLQKVNSYWAKVVSLALDQHRCLPTEVRDPLLDGVVTWKKLHAEFMEMQWHAFAFGKYSNTKSTGDNLLAGNLWISTLREWFDTFVQSVYRGLQSVKSLAIDPREGATRMHQDEQGPFVSYEFLRRKVFGQWAIDKGLLRGLLRHVWQPPVGHAEPVTLGDFGAGGGHYSTWLNETGLMHAFAFDGTSQAAELTDGAVQELNLVEDMQLWRTFDWVMCLEVGEHVPKQFSKALLRNLRRHARQGLVMSWSDDWEGIGHVNCLSREEFVAFVQAETGFVLDAEATRLVKEGCEIDYIARTIAVFRAPAQ